MVNIPETVRILLSGLSSILGYEEQRLVPSLPAVASDRFKMSAYVTRVAAQVNYARPEFSASRVSLSTPPTPFRQGILLRHSAKMEQAPQRQGRRVRRKRGSLQYMTEMPLDVLFEVRTNETVVKLFLINFCR